MSRKLNCSSAAFRLRSSAWRRALAAAGLAACLAAPLAAVQADPSTDAQPQPHSDSLGAAVSDTAITAKIKAKYLDDTRLKNADISVTTTNGVVTLGGSAPGAEAKSAAESLAQSVDGVKSVDNQVSTPSVADTVAHKSDHAAKKAKRAVSDTWITTKVKSSLLADSATKGLEISVTTRNGVVALAGKVDTKDSAEHAETLARSVKGVKSVDTSGLIATQ
ncbi:MAG: BON domain-containing protein [Nevskia sp.]|nr:BON domain-containing protein [Nevskia sp.]